MRIVGVNAPHVIALLIRDHFERKLVVIAQEHCPLTIVGNRRRLIEDVDDRESILHLQRHEHARHEREMKTHVRLVAAAEIGDRVLRPLVRFREQHAAGKFLIDVRAKLFQVDVRLGQILAARAFALVEIGHGVEPQSVNAHGEPEIADLFERFVHGRVLEIQIWLVRIETMPVISLRQRVPGPVRSFEILKDDPRVGIFFRRIAPDVKFALGRTGQRAPRFLEPRILIRGVINH